MRRTFRARTKRTPVAWVRTFFQESTIPTDATISENVLLDPSAVLVPGPTPKLNEVFMVRRVIVAGGVAFQPLNTAFAFEMVVCAWAVYIIDADDSDASIITTAAGTIMASNRILATGCININVKEGTVAQTESIIAPSFPVNVDVRVNAKIRPEELLILAFQFGTTSTSALAAGQFSGYSSVLVNRP